MALDLQELPRCLVFFEVKSLPHLCKIYAEFAVQKLVRNRIPFLTFQFLDGAKEVTDESTVLSFMAYVQPQMINVDNKSKDMVNHYSTPWDLVGSLKYFIFKR